LKWAKNDINDMKNKEEIKFNKKNLIGPIKDISKT
jgi:hypothetical protein